MDTNEYRQMDRRCLWHPYTKLSGIMEDPFPIIVRGEGIYLYDTEGNRYLDATSSWWACNLGHGNARIVAAICKQAGELQHSILGNMSHPRAIELAAQLAELFPSQPRRVLFASDGASAVEAALKIAIQYWRNMGRPERRRLASLHNAYHGDTLGAVSVGRLEAFHEPFDSVLFPVLRAESPCCGGCAHGRNPDVCGLECFDSMQQLVAGHAHELAAVIVEPLCQGAAGMRIYSPRYLARLSALCQEHDVLLIADEIAMGFGRTGKMFAFEHAAIDPDIVCLGKGLSGGYLPLSATVVKATIFDTFRDQPRDCTFYHGHTFTGNPIACAAALETLKIYAEDGIVEKAAQMGALLTKRLVGFRHLPGVAGVRSLGMIGAVELGGPAGAETGTAMARAVRKRMLAQKVLIRPLGNVVYLMPPLIIPEDDLIRTVDLLHAAIEASATASRA